MKTSMELSKNYSDTEWFPKMAIKLTTGQIRDGTISKITSLNIKISIGCGTT